MTKSFSSSPFSAELTLLAELSLWRLRNCPPFVLQQMKSHGIEEVFYHKTDDSRLEIDFVIQREAKLLPIEVKAEGNVRANSLTNFLKANPAIHAIRYSMLPYKEQEQMTNVPLYAVR